jgi:hypothetical protein
MAEVADTRLVVKELDLGVPDASIRLLIGKKARKELAKFLKQSDPDRRFFKTLRRIVAEGAEGLVGENRIIRPEGQGAYAIGITSSRFRLAGFFLNRSQTEFVATGSYMKPGNQNKRGPAGDAACKEAARIKKDRDWRIENEPDPRFPR